MQKLYLFLKITIVLCLSFTVLGNSVNEKNVKNFILLVDYALKNSPDIKNANYEVEKFVGEKIQTKKYINPELDMEVENFGGNLPGSTFNLSESTISITQKIEIGGKRKYRLDSVNYKILAAKERFKSILNEKIYSIFYYYSNTTASYKQLKLAEKMYQLSLNVYKSIGEKVKYGKTSPVEEIKAQLELNRAEIKLNQAKYKFNKFEKLLVSSIGAKKLPFILNYKFLDKEINLSSKQDLKKSLQSSPTLEEIRFMELSGAKELKLAKALKIPDLNFSVGYRRFRETDEKAYVASIGIELPVFNRHKGLIMQKASEKNIIQQNLKKKELDLFTNFENSYKEMLILKKKSNQYESTMVTGARKAYEAVHEGYKSGKFSYLDMLDSMRTLIEFENEKISSLLEYNNALGEVLKTTGYFYESYVKENNVDIKRGEK